MNVLVEMEPDNTRNYESVAFGTTKTQDLADAYELWSSLANSEGLHVLNVWDIYHNTFRTEQELQHKGLPISENNKGTVNWRLSGYRYALLNFILFNILYNQKSA